ncbi:hypothetical protein JCM3765_002828 [Sporobolomyces pararoseus]
MSTLYLPDTLVKHNRRGLQQYLYGWRKEEITLVAGIVEEDYEAAVERVQQIGKSLETQVDILGMLSSKDEAREPYKNSSNFFVLEFRKPYPPRLAWTQDSNWTPRIILYSPLGRLEMLSLRPIPLGISPFEKEFASYDGSRAQRLNSSEPIANRMKAEDSYIDEVINLTPSLNQQVRKGCRPPKLDSSHFQILSRAAGFLRAGFAVNISILSCRLPLVGALRDHSSAARQIVTRLELLSAAPGHYLKYVELSSITPIDTSRKLEAYANYIRFWNTLWLFANDLIIGYALSKFVQENAQYLSDLVETFVQNYISGYLRELLEWLNDWPGGVKLNTELASLICESFLFLSRLWDDFALVPFLPRLPSILRVLGTLGYIGGASLLLAFASDLLHVLTFPFLGCYVAATLTYRWSLVGLSALFNVFRGKKYNPLRARTEPATYSVDALLLGTILFVTLIFLFPTIVAFYLAFASSRLTIVAVQTGFGIAVQALNAFPLFALMLKFKTPARLPYTIQFRQCQNQKHLNMPHLHLENKPLPLSLVLGDL